MIGVGGSFIHSKENNGKYKGLEAEGSLGTERSEWKGGMRSHAGKGGGWVQPALDLL
jgi:hypothetical protein